MDVPAHKHIRKYFYLMLLVIVDCINLYMNAHMQMAGHTSMPTLEEVVDQSSWMMSSAPQVPANY